MVFLVLTIKRFELKDLLDLYWGGVFTISRGVLVTNCSRANFEEITVAESSRNFA